MTTLLNIGRSALSASQGSLATVSHNIANANTAGYSRQEAVLSTAGGLYSGAGFFGRGVDLSTVRRHYDQFLTASVQAAGSASAADGARANGLKGLDAVFADSELGVGAALDAVVTALGDLANRPADLSARQVVLGRVDQFAKRVASVGGQLAALGREADGRLAQDASQVNGQLDQIAKLNARIAQVHAQGQPPNDLLDQRDAAIEQLGSYLSVQQVAQDDGTVALFTNNGTPLLVGAQQARLEAAPDPADASRNALRLSVGNTQQWLDEAALGGGSLAGTLRFRDDDLATATQQVGRIAVVAAAVLNGQQALGVDMDGAVGAALLRVPAPQTTPNSSNASTASVNATITDATALVASDYEVEWDGASYQITRMADGQKTASASLPATLDGVQFATVGAPAVGDRWQVKPFSAAAVGLSAATNSPRQLATAFAASVQAAAANQGSAAATAFGVVRASPDNKLAVTITFNNPPTSFNVTGLASGNLANVPYTPGQRAPAAPADYNGWALALDGTPAAGDSFSVGPNPAPGSDNRNARTLAALFDQPVAGGATLNEAYASLLGDVGSRVQGGTAAAEVSSQLQQEAVSRQQNVAGVNLDEEAADLLRFQQAYQASARIIQTSQSLFESLMSAIGR